MQEAAERVLADCVARREVVRLHESWPVLVEQPPTFEDKGSLTGLVLRVSQRFAWLTEREYRERFGIEPPATPMIEALLASYVDHPDYEWIDA